MRKSFSEELRPTDFYDLFQPMSVIRSLEEMAKQKSPANMLFYGSPGLGKTSAARILLSRLGDNWWEINGSINSGIDVVRQMEVGATSVGLGDGPRVCFIDEAEYLSSNAQAGLRGLIEHTQSHCRFLLTANNILKLQPALKSRCLPVCFDISVADASEAIGRVLPRYLAKLRKLQVDMSENRLSELLHIYFPDLRTLANVIEFNAMSRDQN